MLLRSQEVGYILDTLKTATRHPEIKSAALFLSLQQWLTLKDCKALAFSVNISISRAYGACIGSEFDCI